MISLKILQNLSLMMTSMLKNRQEESLELMLDILHDLLSHLNELVGSDEQAIVDHIHEVFNNFDNCIQLLSLTFDNRIVERASQCVIQLLQVFAQSHLKKKEIYFIESHFPFLLSAIKSDNQTI